MPHFDKFFGLCYSRNIGHASVLKPQFLCKCCSAIRREEVCKQVGCERERLTLYINNTNFPLIIMQQLKHIIFQDLLNEPRIAEIANFL